MTKMKLFTCCELSNCFCLSVGYEGSNNSQLLSFPAFCISFIRNQQNYICWCYSKRNSIESTFNTRRGPKSSLQAQMVSKYLNSYVNSTRVSTEIRILKIKKLILYLPTKLHVHVPPVISWPSETFLYHNRKLRKFHESD